MAIISKVLLLSELEFLTVHFDDPTGTKLFCCFISLHLKHATFVISFHAALTLPLKIYPLFHVNVVLLHDTAGVGYCAQNSDIVLSMMCTL
jgi:hypothetical protein